jgi:type IV secretory pathway protease TraF
MRQFLNQSQSLDHAKWQSSKRVLFFALFPLVVLGVVSICFANRQIVINTSPSVTPGLYVRSNAAPAIGRLVEFRIPASVRSYIQSRTGHDGEDWYILKPVVAGPGDRVDTTGGALRINNKVVAPMPPMRDGFGNALPRWTQNRVLVLRAGDAPRNRIGAATAHHLVSHRRRRLYKNSTSGPGMTRQC